MITKFPLIMYESIKYVLYIVLLFLPMRYRGTQKLRDFSSVAKDECLDRG